MLATTKKILFSLLPPIELGKFLPLMTEARTALAMSLPLVLSQAAQTSVMFIDSMLMGRLGPQALAGGALALTSYYFCIVLAFGLTAACGNLVALAHGADDRRGVVAATRACLLLCLAASLVIGVVLWHAEPVMLWLGQPPETARGAAGFLHILVWSMPFNLMFLTLRNFASGIGRPGPVPFITLLALLFAPGCGWLLSQGVGGWHGLGLDGIALSSALTFSLIGLVFAYVVSHADGFAEYHVFARLERRDFAALGALLRQGLPSAGTMGLEGAMFTCSAYLMGAQGAAALAAHQGMLQLLNASFVVPLGLSYGVSMCVGQAAGAGEFDRVKLLARVGLLAVAAWTLMTTLALLLAPETLIGLFLPDDVAGADVARQAALLLAPIAAALCLIDGLQVVLSGVLRALKDATSTMVIYSLGCTLIGIPLAWLLPRHGFGPRGVWFGMLAGLLCVSLLMLLRVRYMNARLTAGRWRG
jgi:MATE family multidrug resistance protein